MTNRTITIHDIREKNRVFRGRKIEGKAQVGRHVEVTPGVSVRLFGTDRNRYVKDETTGRMVPGERAYDLTFRVGDTCERDSFNLVYLGRIEAITEKTITIRDDLRRRAYRMDLATFERRNYDFDLAKAEKRNSEWMD